MRPQKATSISPHPKNFVQRDDFSKDTISNDGARLAQAQSVQDHRGQERDDDIRTPSNRLGTFIRQRRKSMGLTLAQVASEINYSLSLVSKTELGQLPEGPTLKMLDRVAKALKVDVMRLVELKEQDAETAHKTAVNAPEAERVFTEVERHLLLSFRALDGRLQQSLLGQAQLIHSLQENSRDYSRTDPSHAAPALLSHGHEQEHPLPEKLADANEAVGRDYRKLRHFAQAVASYENAQVIYEQLGRMGSVARMWFYKGSILNHLSRYGEGDKAEQQQRPRLDNANFCFSQAAQLFQEARRREKEAPWRDDEKEYEPENLRHWAINDMQTARTSIKVEEGTPAYHLAVLQHYLDKAFVKQKRAEELFVAWIHELESRITALNKEEKSSSRDDFAGDATANRTDQYDASHDIIPDDLGDMMAKALHRKALLHSNVAAEHMRAMDFRRGQGTERRNEENGEGEGNEKEKADKEEAITQSALCRASFKQAMRIRRELAIAAPSQERRDYHLSKLADDHQALAYAIQHYTLPAIPRIQHEQALYHLLLAEQINSLVSAEDDPEQRKSIHLLTATLERDNPLGEDMRVAIRRRVEARLGQVEVGTREQPILVYDIDSASFEAAI